MPASAALPFLLTRSHDEIAGSEITSTREKVHGLLRLDGERLRIQWRVARSTDRVGVRMIRKEHELEPVREVIVPLRAIAAAVVRWRWWEWPPGPRLLLVAADLRAFEEVAGAAGLRLDHPAELALRIRQSDSLAAREFAGELALALAEQAMRTAEQLQTEPPLDRARMPAERAALPPERVSTRLDASVPPKTARDVNVDRGTVG